MSVKNGKHFYVDIPPPSPQQAFMKGIGRAYLICQAHIRSLLGTDMTPQVEIPQVTSYELAAGKNTV